MEDDIISTNNSLAVILWVTTKFPSIKTSPLNVDEPVTLTEPDKIVGPMFVNVDEPLTVKLPVIKVVPWIEVFPTISVL